MVETKETDGAAFLSNASEASTLSSTLTLLCEDNMGGGDADHMDG